MKNRIKENITNPEELEKMYQSDRKSFESGFKEIYPEIQNSDLARFWKIRLDFDEPVVKDKAFNSTDLFVLIVACTFTGILIKLPDLINLGLGKFFYYEKYAGLIVLFGLSIYAIFADQIFNRKKLVFTIIAFTIPAIYINLLPAGRDSDSATLAYIHLPLFMWCVYGLVFIDLNVKDKLKRIDYIRYNGDLAIWGAVIAISGMILTGVTIGLFSTIGINIEEFYFEYVVIWGMVSAPIVATFIIRNYPGLTHKIAPVIANLFSPLVLITLIIYLISIPVSGKDPYQDREFLLVFNLMLLGVMGIIAFSISEISKEKRLKFNEMILFILSIITLLIDLIALSAIFYRLGEYGITPNRMAVLGSNLLIFGNLVWIMTDLYKVNFRKAEIEKLELTIARYLPVYAIWALIVVFGFPFIFGMK